MTEKPNKKRIVVYIVVLVAFAMLIVFLSRRTQNKTMSSMSESVGMAVAPMMDSVMDDGGDFAKNSVPEMAATPVSRAQILEGEEVTAIDGNEGELEVTKRVIKTGDIDMRVNSVEAAISEIKAIAATHGGDEVSSDISKNDVYKHGFVVVKVPVNQYSAAFEEIKMIAPLVVSESSQSQDVTAQFIDLESRIKNKKEHEERLRSFFKKADDVDELIQIERELARVRTEVEQMESRLKYLKEQTQYSTIHVTLREDSNIVVSDSWRPMQVVKDSFNTLIKKATNLLNIVIRFTITSLPFIIIFMTGAWFLYFTAKHIFGKNRGGDENE